MSTIASLVVDVIANTGPFAKGMAKARAEASLFSKGISSLKGVLAGFGGALVAGFTIKGLQGTAEDIDRINKAASKLGIATEKLSALEHAASLSDVSFETLTKSLTIMERNLGSGKSEEYLTKLGLKLNDLRALSADKALLVIADKIKAIGDVATRTDVTMGIFGKGGTEMSSLLLEGADGIEQLMNRARELGLTFDEEAGDKVEEFNDALTNLMGSIKGLARELVTTLGPALTSTVDGLTDFITARGVVASGGSESHGFYGDKYDKILGGMSDQDFQKFLAARRQVGQMDIGDRSEAMAKLLGNGLSATDISSDDLASAISRRLDAITEQTQKKHQEAGILVGEVDPFTAIKNSWKAQEEENAENKIKRVSDADWRSMGGADEARIASMIAALPALPTMPVARKPGDRAPGFSVLEAGTAEAFRQERRSAEASKEMDTAKQQLEVEKQQAKTLSSIDANLKKTQKLEIINMD